MDKTEETLELWCSAPGAHFMNEDTYASQRP